MPSRGSGAGMALVEMHVSLRARLMKEPALRAQVEILNPGAEPGNDGIVLARVRSAELPADAFGQFDIIVEGSKVRFKNWVDA